MIYHYIWISTFAPLLGPIGGGGGGLVAFAGPPSAAGGAGGGADASPARTTSFLLGLEKVSKLIREDVVVVEMLEVRTKLEAAEAKLEAAIVLFKLLLLFCSPSLSNFE